MLKLAALLVLLPVMGYSQEQYSSLAAGIRSLPSASVYFTGQLHNSGANAVIEKTFLFNLNKDHGVRNVIIEYGHSAAFLLNLYLKSGNDSLLKYIHPQAGFDFIRSVKQFNDTVPAARKVTFYGIDFEGREDGRHLKKAFEYIHSYTEIPKRHELYVLITGIIQAPPASIEKAIKKMRSYMDRQVSESRKYLGVYYLDALLMCHAQYGFVPRRDDEMYDNFKRIYRELAARGEHPAFYGSFGMGHINPANSRGIANRLLNSSDSPVMNSVSITGVHYFNCAFGTESNKRTSEGILDFLCKSIPATDKTEACMYFIPLAALANSKCEDAVNRLTGLVIVANFGPSGYWMWE